MEEFGTGETDVPITTLGTQCPTDQLERLVITTKEEEKSQGNI